MDDEKTGSSLTKFEVAVALVSGATAAAKAVSYVYQSGAEGHNAAASALLGMGVGGITWIGTALVLGVGGLVVRDAYRAGKNVAKKIKKKHLMSAGMIALAGTIVFSGLYGIAKVGQHNAAKKDKGQPQENRQTGQITNRDDQALVKLLDDARTRD